MQETHSDRSRPWLGLLFAVVVACGVDRPLVERMAQDGWQPAPFQLVSMGGQRAGATVEFVLRLKEASGHRLMVEGTFEINPQARLVAGRWVEDGESGARSGVLSAATVDFFGGQGDRPALGGELILSMGGATVYRINLPTTTLTAER